MPWLASSEPATHLLCVCVAFERVPAGDSVSCVLCIDSHCSLSVPVVNPGFEQHTLVTGKSIQVTKPCCAWSDGLATWPPNHSENPSQTFYQC